MYFLSPKRMQVCVEDLGGVLDKNHCMSVGWKSFGVAAEISAIVFEEAFDFIKSPLARITLPDAPAPASGPLEAAYYPGKNDVKKAIEKVLL